MISLDHALVYDIETFPNCFTFNCQGLFSDLEMTFEISHTRDDRRQLLAWFCHWRDTETPLIGYNNLGFDYPVLHFIYENPDASVEDIYDRAMEIISNHSDRFGFTVWASDRFCPQIDLYKIFHFDNFAKRTSLKALQFAMRSESILESPVPFGVPVTREQTDLYVIPYNRHDTARTKQFALYALEAIKFRIGLSETLRGDVLNFSDSKLGSKILEQRLGDEVCYDGRAPRQTFRSSIPLAEIIFSYIQFQHPEFNRVLSWMRTQTLTSDDLTETIQTKGVFKGVKATVGGLDFHFGTGGIHGSISGQRVEADDEWGIYDIDVAALYPSIAIVNRLYPEHLGEAFVREYARLPQERKEWQVKKGKKCIEANSMKLASNGTYGNSNNKYSVFCDPRFTMTITINGQLLLCMLAEWLTQVDGLQLLMINTDGITYRCRRAAQPHAQLIQRIWERTTALTLESVEYRRMWVRDVNSYVAESVDGKLKQKGAYEHPDPLRYAESISEMQPPGWHKDWSNVISVRAAVEHMVRGVDIGEFIRNHRDPYDFMCRAKCDRASRLMIGEREVQRITRYYIAVEGDYMRKVSPPTGTPGSFKRKSGITDAEWAARTEEWDERFHTKNRSKYETREMSIESGFKVAECNVAADFDFCNVNYDWYVDQARKLVVT